MLSIPALLLIRQGSLAAIALGMAALGLLLVTFTAAMPSTLPALFPTKVRYGSLSIGFNVSVSLFGGTTPLVVTALIGATGNKMMPAYYMMAAAVIGGIAVLLMSESARKPLPGSPCGRRNRGRGRRDPADGTRHDQGRRDGLSHGTAPCVTGPGRMFPAGPFASPGHRAARWAT